MKKLMAILISVIMVISSMTIPVFASVSETYDGELTFAQKGHYFTVVGRNFKPSQKCTYSFYAAAYGTGDVLLGVKQQDNIMTTVGGDLVGAVSFGNEEYLSSIKKVKTMLWDSELRPVKTSQEFTITDGSFEMATSNVALNKPAFSYNSAEGLAAGMAVDDDTNTYWKSLGASSLGALSDNYVIDLGTEYVLSSVVITPVEGASAENITIYGANEILNTTIFDNKRPVADLVTAEQSKQYKDWVKTELGETGSEAITVAKTVNVNGSARYIILEQAADSSSAMGFAEVVVNGAAIDSSIIPTTGNVTLLSRGKTVESFGTHQSYKFDSSLGVDDNPSTGNFGYGSLSIANSAGKGGMGFLIDLGNGNATPVTHIAYQAVSQYTPTSTDFEYYKRDVSEFQIVASNDGTNFVELGYAGMPAYESVISGHKCDTGMWIFPVDTNGQAYRYVGLRKVTSAQRNVWYFQVNTFQAYGVVTPEPEAENIALNKPAFSYHSATGLTPAMAVDGDDDTAWISLGANSLGTVKDNFVIDLGADYSLQSIEITPALDAAAENVTIYGAYEEANTSLNDPYSTSVTVSSAEQAKAYKDWKKSKLGETGADDITEKKTIDVSGTYRYIVLEQTSATSAMGFAEIAVNGVLANEQSSPLTGPVSLLSNGKSFISGGTNNSYKFDTTKVTDSDPSTGTFGYGNSSNAGTTGQYLLIDLGEGNTSTVSHLVYQGATYTGHNVSSGTTDKNKKYYARSVSEFQIVGSNDGTTFTELGYAGTPDLGTMVEDNETGLWVFPVNTNGTVYRYVGIRRVTSAQNNAWYTNVNTLQAWGTPAQ